MSYNKDTDYQEKINEAVADGDYVSAAKYEQSRNEKIDAEKLDYEKTNKYSGWLDNTDYSTVLKEQMASNASRKTVSDTLKKRVTKASSTEGLTQYAADDVYDQAIRYLTGSGSFTFNESKPQYKGSYENEIRSLYKKLSNLKSFNYKPEDDDLYEYYREQYLREGDRAMEEILGEIAMNTGGIASSYAVSAAAQSRNYYNSKLTDMIPKLYGDAYERYLDGIERQEKNLGILSDLSENEYDRYLDNMKQFNENRKFEYEKMMDASEFDERALEREIDSQRDERDYVYLLEKLAEEKEQNRRKAEQQERDNEEEITQTKIENALKKWENMGYLDSESAAILGLPEGLHTTDYDYKKAQQYKLYNK